MKNHIVEAGDQFIFGDVQKIPIWVVEVGSEVVHISVDHPLAGLRLEVEIEVLEVREATAEELEHEHPHFEGEVYAEE